MKRVVLDTDVVVAALRSPQGASAELLRRVHAQELRMLASVSLFAEYEAVLTRPEQLRATRQSAETSYGVLLDPKSGFTRDAAISVAGVRTAVQLREKYGKPQKKMQPVESYIDTSFHREASRR